MTGSARAPLPAEPRRPPLLGVGRAVTAADVPDLCVRAAAAAATAGSRSVACDLQEVGETDLGTVDALARLTLTLARSGLDVHFLAAPADLRALVELVGLRRVVRCVGPSAVEPER